MLQKKDAKQSVLLLITCQIMKNLGSFLLVLMITENQKISPISDQLLTTLADSKTNGNILPPPTITVEKRILRGVGMAVSDCLAGRRSTSPLQGQNLDSSWPEPPSCYSPR